jgi:predicted lipoprotein with Yx(FWY)xxD motif
MKPLQLVAASIVAVVVAGSALAAGPDGSTISTSRRGEAATATVKVAYNRALKRSILVTSRGFTLYAFTDDANGTPHCYDDSAYHCSRAWPPLKAVGAPHAATGVEQSLLRTVKHSDGGYQVTYAGHPLYTDAGAKAFGLAGDRKAGDAHGQAFFGSWFVVSPTGALIGR